jgi:hypothetical protein
MHRRPDLLWDLGAFAISFVPVAFVASMFLSSPIVPPGGDPAHHAYLVQQMLANQQAVAQYSQFPSNGATFEYPSLFDLATALVVVTTGLGVFAAMETLVTVLSFLSPLCYWRFFYRFLNGSSRDAFLACAMISLGWFAFLRTVRDGSYGEVLGAGVLLPLWVGFLWGERRILAPATFFAILITHNLSAAMAGAVLIAYVVTFALMRNRSRVLHAIDGHALMFLVTLIPFWSVYASYVLPIATGASGGYSVFGIGAYPDLLTWFLLGLGLLGAIVAARVPRDRFATIWVGLFLILSQTSFAAERFLRETAFPLAFGATLLAIRVEDQLRKSRRSDGPRLATVFLVGFMVAAALNGLPQLSANADPKAEYYLQPHQLQAYEWLENRTALGQAVLSVYAADPYLAPFVPVAVYGIVSLNYSSSLSSPDRALNAQLLTALFNFSSSGSLATFRTFGIRWILVSTPAPKPIFTLPSELSLIRQALFLPFTLSGNYTIAGTWFSSVGFTRIVEVNSGP